MSCAEKRAATDPGGLDADTPPRKGLDRLELILVELEEEGEEKEADEEGEKVAGGSWKGKEVARD